MFKAEMFGIAGFWYAWFYYNIYGFCYYGWVNEDYWVGGFLGSYYYYYYY